MIHLKSNPKGIDKPIQLMQLMIQKEIDFDIDIYGRIYLIKKDDKTIPVYHQKDNDFKEVIPTSENNSKGCLFFIESNTTNSRQTISETDVEIIAIVNIQELFKENTHVSDEELKVLFYEILKKYRFFYSTEITITKGNQALRSIDTDLKHMFPYCLLRFEGKIEYQLDI